MGHAGALVPFCYIFKCGHFWYWRVHLPQSNKQAILRSSPFLALGGVTISRRSAAGSCADAQGPLTRAHGPVRSVQSTSPSASIWWVTGDDVADKLLQKSCIPPILTLFAPGNSPCESRVRYDVGGTKYGEVWGRFAPKLDLTIMA